MRRIRIINTLTHDEHTLEVCAEENIASIRQRYLAYNSHADSYIWKRLGKRLDMDATLEDNGIPDESEEFYQLNLSESFYCPAIHLYFADDLTVA